MAGTEVVEPSQSWSGDIITALGPVAHATCWSRTPSSQAASRSTRTGAHLLPATIDGNNRLWLLDVGRQSPRASRARR